MTLASHPQFWTHLRFISKPEKHRGPEAGENRHLGHQRLQAPLAWGATQRQGSGSHQAHSGHRVPPTWAEHFLSYTGRTRSRALPFLGKPRELSFLFGVLKARLTPALGIRTSLTQRMCRPLCLRPCCVATETKPSILQDAGWSKGGETLQRAGKFLQLRKSTTQRH